MSDPFTAAAALAAASVYIARTAYEYVLRSKNGNDAERQRCKAEVISDKLQASMDVQTALLKDIKDSQQDVRDGVRDLVSIAKQK